MAQFETKITNEQFVSKELKAENDRVRAQLDTEHQAYQAELQKRDLELNRLRQKIEELNHKLYAKEPEVEADFDPSKIR